MFYSQKKYPIKLGNCNTTIKAEGCYLVSWCNLRIIQGDAPIPPDEMNEIFIENNLYSARCLFNSQAVSKYFNRAYQKASNAQEWCIAETNYYKPKGVPQHFFCYNPKSNTKIDPLDLEPFERKNNYPIVSYRIFKPMEKNYHGIDISHWQGLIDWDKIKTDFVFQKCTQGYNFLDATYIHNKKSCKEKDIPFGSYHFADGKDPIKEADWYLKNCGDEQLVLDWETEHADPQDWCDKFIQRIKDKTGKDCLLYTNEARANKYKFKHPMWIARYGTNDGTMQKEPTQDWLIWQYTSKGKVDGIEGNVDMNIAKIEFDATSPQDEPEPSQPHEIPPEPQKPPTNDSGASSNEPIPTDSMDKLVDVIINFIKKAYEKVNSFFNK